MLLFHWHKIEIDLSEQFQSMTSTPWFPFQLFSISTSNVLWKLKHEVNTVLVNSGTLVKYAWATLVYAVRVGSIVSSPTRNCLEDFVKYDRFARVVLCTPLSFNEKVFGYYLRLIRDNSVNSLVYHSGSFRTLNHIWWCRFNILI